MFLVVVNVMSSKSLSFLLFQSFVQPLNRVLTGNYEYRMFLRCRHAAKMRFVRLRSDVLVKLQLLDNKRGTYIYMYIVATEWLHMHIQCIYMM